MLDSVIFWMFKDAVQSRSPRPKCLTGDECLDNVSRCKNFNSIGWRACYEMYKRMEKPTNITTPQNCFFNRLHYFPFRHSVCGKKNKIINAKDKRIELTFSNKFQILLNNLPSVWFDRFSHLILMGFLDNMFSMHSNRHDESLTQHFRAL